MKKSDAISDVKNDFDTKRLFRSVNEISHYLDQQRNRIRLITDLFSNTNESNRARLCSYIEKLIFLAPLEYGRKCEEILWRKCFYDVYTTLKRLKKDPWTDEEVALLNNLLYSGIGFYHNLITRLQEEFRLDLDGVSEFPLHRCNYGLQYYSNGRIFGNKTSEFEKTKDWATCCVHRNLVYIGDLNRYMFDLYPGWDVSVANRYYLKALYLKPEVGMPHNQLGTLSNSQNLTLDAVYRYLRCLYCKELFDGAEGNLIAILEQYPPIGLAYNNLPLKKRIFSQFLHLIGVWFLQKSPIKDVDQLCLEFVENIGVWFPEAEATMILKHDPVSLKNLVETKQSKGFDLPESEYTVLKILIVFIICHDKLRQRQRKGVSLTNTTTTVIVSIISKAIEYIANKLKENIPGLTPPSVKKENGFAEETQKIRRRRRRRIMKTGLLSDDELSDNSDLSPDADSDVESEENLIFDEYFDDEMCKTNGYSNSNGKANGIVNGKSAKLVNGVNADQVFKFFRDQLPIMQAIKISCDWLQCNKDVLVPITSWKTVFENLTTILNYSMVLIDPKKDNREMIPLTEDVELKALQALKSVQDKMCWKWNKITTLTEKEEVKQRLWCLCNFGKYLISVENSNVSLDTERNWFSVNNLEENVEEKESKKINDEQRGKLMKEMGQLWLEAEVKNLESKMKQSAKVNLLTPYLVVDSEALTQHCILVKKLVSSRQFVLLIPTAVVSALDELKRTSGRARDAIRWLEAQFRQGNRFLRMQRNNEKQAIPSVSYPRKKDNEAWLFIQIMECCYYLNHTNESKINGKKEEDSNFVRLLTGSRALSSLADSEITIPKDKSVKPVPFSMAVVKKSTGLLIEHIVDFYGKWKDSTKSRG